MLAISKGMVIFSPLSRESMVGTLDAAVFREISDLFNFYVFMILFKFI